MSRLNGTATATRTLLLICISLIVHRNQFVAHNAGARSLQAQRQEPTAAVAPQAPQETPDFEEPIGNHTVAMGRDAQLSCKISKLGNFRTAWLRVEDKGILTIHTNVITRNYRFGLLNNDNERNFVLTIKNVQPSDKGGYMCQINSVPMKYAIGYLDVLTPPIFDGDSPAVARASGDELSDSTSAPEHTNSSQVTVREGTSATLACRARGHPTPTITWRREDGKPILLNGIDSDADQSPSEIRDTTTLTFPAVHRANSGAYLCIASNGVQPAASKRQLLDVQFSPVVSLPAAEVAGFVGQREARLDCVVDANPAGSYHWIKLATTTTNTDRKPVVTNQEDDLWLIDHDELTQSDKYDIVMKQISSERVHMILTLRHIERQDFSWFKCIAKNALGLQSNFIRFYETAAPPPSSGFSLNSMFRSGGSTNTQLPSKQQDEPTVNDEQQEARTGGQARAHTRSSWIQRSTSGGNSASSRSSSSRLEPSSASSAATSSKTLLILRNPLFTNANIMYNHCHYYLSIAALVPYFLVALTLATIRLAQPVVSVTT